MKRILWISAVAVTFFALTFAIHADESRIWTSSTGQKMEAELIKISDDGKTVTLRRKDNGKEGDVALDKLSSADKSYVTRQKKETEQAKVTEQIVSFEEELKESGLNNLSDFVNYGTAELKRELQANGDIFDKEAAKVTTEPKIKAVQSQIAKKTFVVEYAYSTAVVKVDGNKSSFWMMIPPSKSDLPQGQGRRSSIGTVSFPVPNVTADLTRASVNLQDRRTQSDGVQNQGPVIILPVSGNTDNIKELVRNSDIYRARMHFKIQYVATQQEVRSAMPRQRGIPVKTVEVIVPTAEILKIEIIKADRLSPHVKVNSPSPPEEGRVGIPTPVEQNASSGTYY